MAEHKQKETDEQAAGWQYHADGADGDLPAEYAMPSKSKDQHITWTASEFVANQKNTGWYILLALAASVLSIGVYLFTHDLISSIAIIIVATILAVFAARQPRTLDYKLDGMGLYIDKKFYPYMDFKSFAVLDEDAISSIVLMPLKRFMPPLTVYYAPKDEDDILGILGDFLPFEQRQHDAVDRFMKRIRF